MGGSCDGAGVGDFVKDFGMYIIAATCVSCGCYGAGGYAIVVGAGGAGYAGVGNNRWLY